MGTKILEVHPKEVQFIFEPKKQSSCTVQLINKTNYDVAFKVKTTSPKKYRVRPNLGVVPPRSTRDFTVTMQAQKVAPPDLVCKDKFLIQSTVVPAGTTEPDITTSMFSKDDGKHVEEIKLRVVLVSPPHSPVLSPINGVLKEGPILEDLLLQDPSFRKVQAQAFSEKFSREWDSRPLDDQKLNKEKDTALKPVNEISGQGWEFFNDHEFNIPKNMELKPEKDASGQLIAPSRGAEFASAKNVVTGHETAMNKPAELSPVKEQISIQEAAASVGAEVAADKEAINGTVSLSPRDGNYTPAKDEISRWESQQDNVRGSSPGKLFKHAELKAQKEEDLKPEQNTVHDEMQKPAEEAPLAPARVVSSIKFKAAEELTLIRDIEEMKMKLKVLESKLNEAGVTISKLTGERRLSIQERKMLHDEIALLRRRTNMRKVQAGLPLLFVIMVALISTLLGYLSHA